ncbi:MFS transporter [Actinomadura sp. HBU206391]|uniref:MFS transporter n=1 Tax=Actinomadura sp. HBU206391 TaxID=2731692 RepID=UPI00164F2E09|nr:MFS transporter [Actinomadura sp. HBU206391]MBC6459752.1 MFS transporter [Actinomadura sp. HBU206391]
MLFVHRQRTLTDPLLDLRLFGDGVFSTGLAIGLLTGIVMAGATLLSTLYLQVVVGLSPLHTGLWLLPQNVAMAACMMITPALATRIRRVYVMAAGLTIAAGGFGLLTRVSGDDGTVLLVTGLVLASGGIALPMALTMNLVLGATPPDKAGSVASIMETSGEFGVASLGSLGTAAYRSGLADALPAGIPDDVARARAGEHHRRRGRGPAAARTTRP